MDEYLIPLKKYADFTGRAPRAEYWKFYLAVMLGFLPLGLIAAMAAAMHSVVLLILSGLLFMALGFGTLVPFFAVGVRRLHDRGLSGWWMLICLVPYLGGLALFVLYCLPGTVGDNKFGPDPYAELNNVPAPAAAPAATLSAAPTDKPAA